MEHDIILDRMLMNVVRSLPDKERHEIYDAIMDYALTGEVRELSSGVTVAFAFIRQDLDNKKGKKKRGNPNFQEGKTNPYYSGIKDNSSIIQDNSEIIQDNSDNNYPNYPDYDMENPEKNAATDNSGAIPDNSDNNYPIISASSARAINEPQYMGSNLDINNNLNINKPESDSKLISPVDNLNNPAGVIELKSEDKVINKKDNPTHAYAREEKAALRVESPENAATVRKPETMEEKRAKCGMRKQKFKEELAAYMQSYPADMLRDFFDYWTEMNKSRTMMRFEQQKTWETRLRLATWARRDEARVKARKRGCTIREAVSAVAQSIEQDKGINLKKLLNG